MLFETRRAASLGLLDLLPKMFAVVWEPKSWKLGINFIITWLCQKIPPAGRHFGYWMYLIWHISSSIFANINNDGECYESR
jgi:hypothetical protein